MKLSSKCSLPTILAVVSLADVESGTRPRPPRRKTLSQEGVTIRILETPFVGDIRSLDNVTIGVTLAQTNSPEQLVVTPCSKPGP